MSRDYKILEKARRTGDLFDAGGDESAAVSPLETESLGEAGDEPTRFEDVVAEDESPQEAVDPNRASWQRILSEQSGKQVAASASRLGIFGFEDRNLSSIAVAGAQWMARHSTEPVLLVEADWRRSSGVAGVLQLDRRGLGEALNDPDVRMGSLIQENVCPNLAVLGAGASPFAKGPRLAEKIGSLLSTLRRRFPAVFLVMPPTVSPDWSNYASAGLADVGLLAIRPQTLSRRRTELGMGRVRQTGFPVAACLLDIGAGAQVAFRLNQLSQSAASKGRGGEL